jgi:hypothetical protein
LGQVLSVLKQRTWLYLAARTKRGEGCPKLPLFQEALYRRMPRRSGDVCSSFELLVAEISVGASVQEYRDDVGVTFPASDHQRSIAKSVTQIRSRPFLEKQTGDIGHSGFRGEDQRRVPGLRRCVDCSTVAKEQLRGIMMAVLKGDQQRRQAFVIGDVLIGLLLQQCQYSCRIAVIGGGPQRRVPSIVAGVDRHSFCDKQIQKIEGAHGSSDHQRGGAPIKNNRGVGFVIEEKANNLLMTAPNGQGQCRFALLTSGGDIRPAFDQGIDDISVSSNGGKHERTLAGPIVYVDVRLRGKKDANCFDLAGPRRECKGRVAIVVAHCDVRPGGDQLAHCGCLSASCGVKYLRIPDLRRVWRRTRRVIPFWRRRRCQPGWGIGLPK